MKARLPKGMGGGPQNMNAMIKQAQKMQEDMATLQEDLDAREYDIKAGGGVVTAVVSGKHELVSIKIDPEAVDSEDVEILEDMVLVAVNEALRGVAEAGERRLASVTGGMSIPGLF